MSETVTMTLTDFLRACIADDEARARLADGDRIRTGVKVSRTSPIGDLSFVSRFDPARVLAECEAKWKIVEFYEDAVDDLLTRREGRVPASRAYETLRALAAVYADHPDYRDEWRP